VLPPEEREVSTAVEARPGRTWVKVVLGVLCALMAAMWFYYFVTYVRHGSDPGIYQLEDTTWREKAGPVCQSAQDQRALLVDKTEGYIANPTPEQMAQRADIVDKATDILDQMVTDLVAIPVNNENDVSRLEVFDTNYRIVLSDRRRYTASLRRFELVPYSETLVAGGPVSNVVLDFTAGVKGNDVPECSPPGELGGDVQA
jgi:hypothetical protein